MISVTATSSLVEVILLERFLVSVLLDAFLAFLEMFAVTDIFPFVSHASFDFDVFDIFDDFVVWNPPPSPVVVKPGLWEALGVGAK